MHLKIADLFKLDVQLSGVFVKLWPFGQLHLSGLGVYADPWSAATTNHPEAA